MKPTKDSFLKNVENYKLSVLLDNGVYRHLELSSGSFNERFEIVTFPNYIVFTGDMGSFTFSRVHDMFDFFRGEHINPGYWSEKLQAVDCTGGGVYRTGSVKEFDWNTFHSELLEQCGDTTQQDWLSKELECVEADEYGAVAFIREFDNDNEAELGLTEDWEGIPDGMVWKYHFIWCCYAIQWAIQLFDNRKEVAV